MEKSESAHMVTQGKRKGQTKLKNDKGKILVQIEKVSKCFFCHKKGHMTKDCSKLKIHLEKKGTEIPFVCYESNMVNVCDNTWWIDSSTTIHISNALQGFLSRRMPMKSEQFIYSRNKIRSHVEAVGTCRLALDSGFVLDRE